MAQKVSDVMTPAPVAVAPDESLAHAAQLMRQHGIGDVLVMDQGRLRGLVTDRDIVVRAVAQNLDATRTSVADICSTDLVTVSPDDDVDSAVRLMRERAVRRIPVVMGDRPVGMVSLGDMALERDRRSALADISQEPPNI